jgi:2-oxoglutarate dehydrogenase E2 component (dihydrolipoamide succinyltransferase)
MPQMGESIAEGTIVRWIKKVGDPIDKDEPLFEISTDKVDAEIPVARRGRAARDQVKEGETVPVNSVVALIGAKGEKERGYAAPCRTARSIAGSGDRARSRPQSAAEPARSRPAPVALPAATLDDLRRTRSSPLVRNIAKEHGVDISR